MCTLCNASLQNGVWSAVIETDQEPQIVVTYLSTALDDVTVERLPDENQWLLSVKIPTHSISDGVQTFLVQNHGEPIADFSFVAGEPLAKDLRQQISLMRAELDMLKKAFRRSMRQAGG